MEEGKSKGKRRRGGREGGRVGREGEEGEKRRKKKMMMTKRICMMHFSKFN